MASDNTSDGLGSARSWSLSPAINVTPITPVDGSRKQKVLLVGGCEIASALKTLCEYDGDTELCLHLLHDSAEGLTRTLLLLAIALDNDVVRQERTELFLEIFGNVLLREKTNTYMIAQSKALLSFVCNEGDHVLKDFVDLSELRFKDRDAIESVLQFYIHEGQFHIENLREHRLRHYFGERYDARLNLIDWDYVMELRKQASIVHRYHYKRWRMTGQAFELREAKYEVPNRTLASVTKAKRKSHGTSVLVRGYWSDIIVSPYISFGVKASERRLFKKRSDENIYNSFDVSRFNLMQLLTRLDTNENYEMIGLDPSPETHPKEKEEEQHSQSPKIEVIDDDAEGEQLDEVGVGEIDAEEQEEVVASRPPRKVKLIPMLNSESLWTRTRHEHSFDLVHLALNCDVKFNSRLKLLLKERSEIQVEALNFVPTIRDEQRQSFVDSITKIASEAGWVPRPDRLNDAKGEPGSVNVLSFLQGGEPV